MRIFVVGTGRCGTVTFTKAAQHATNYVATHESTAGMRHPSQLAFADNRVEVSPHLTWMLGPLMERNQVEPVMLVHLQRRRAEVVDSWMRRGPTRGPGLWTPLSMRLRGEQLSPDQYREACGLCYDSMTSTIQTFFATLHEYPQAVRPMHIWLHEIEQQWPLFWRRIGAKGDLRASLAELKRRHNAS